MNVRPFIRVGPRAGCIVTLLALLVLLLARSAWGQVTAVAELRRGVAELKIGNPTQQPLAVRISLFRDASDSGGPVVLGDSVSALITPSSFTLGPGELQTVRVRIREPVASDELLRVVTMLDPRVTRDSTPSLQVSVVMRLITKMKVVEP